MIIMFGDHLPNLLDGFYDELAGKTSLSTEEFYRRQYQTPYIIWTNYEISMPEIPLMNVNFFGVNTDDLEHSARSFRADLPLV